VHTGAVAVIELDSNSGHLQRRKMWKGTMMPEENQENVCPDQATSVNGVLIEALDNFLRRT